mmetsp:Transcript_2750/g.3714  ORF Transcript_2750/g.3714 Transcript_2750/m.3714 type:complete len:424 (-) Transcript_2750:57-1328(-)
MVKAVSDRALSVASFKVMDILERANQLSANGHEVNHCEVGQPGTGAPKLVAQAAVDALNSGTNVLGYTDAFGLLPLRQKIADHYTTKYKDLKQAPLTSRIVVTTGSSGAFLLAFTACFDAGDVIAIASSGYPCYRNILSALDCDLAHININHEFKLTACELRAEVEKRKETPDAKQIKGLILSSPGNPTGAMLTPDELKELCEYCDKEDIQFLSDEIYHGITYGKQESTALEFTSNAIIINSFSKYYSMSGWRLGWMVIPEHVVSAINSLQQNMFINAPTVSQTAALKCWEDETTAELENHVAKYRLSREIILKALAKLPGLDQEKIAPADGGFYVYIDLGDENTAPGMGSVAMCSAFLEEKYVALTPGIDFEDPSTELGDRRFRISYAGGIETATQAMERLATFWPSWIDRVKQAKSSSQDK